MHPGWLTGKKSIVEVGCHYTVIRQFKCECGCEQEGYVLAEDPLSSYDVTHFARLSGLDETNILAEGEGAELDEEFRAIVHEMETE